MKTLRCKLKSKREDGGKPTSLMGVRQNEQTGKFLAFVRTSKETKHHYTDLGWYDNAEGAARAHDSEKLKRFGPTARLNFPVAVPKDGALAPATRNWVRQLAEGQPVYQVRRVRVHDADGHSTWRTEYLV